MLLARCETNFMYMSDSLSTGSLDQINKQEVRGPEKSYKWGRAGKFGDIMTHIFFRILSI